jgi:peptidoglycan/xylan/chitin deacetylase (PgdA/CDA1 family)
MFFSLTFVSGGSWINLDGVSGEVQINDSNSLSGFSEATWNMWINQDIYNKNAGIVGRYRANTGFRSYLIRTALVEGSAVSVVLSGDGTNIGTYTTESSRKCGIRENGNWTMITVAYDGSLIKYYRDGILCDQDATIISSIYNSDSPLRLGAGNSVFFEGGIDEFTFYNQSLPKEQISRIYNESAYGTNLGQSIPVLVYHMIRNPVDDAVVVSPEHFQEQMNYLYENEFETITLEDYFNWRNGTYVMPEKPIILIFDDGFSTTHTTAKLIMDQYGFIGTIPIVTRYASFTGNNTGYMRWTEIKELTDAGWGVESHSVDHAHMLNLNESQFRQELSYSKELIINKTGKIPLSFIFPFHESNNGYTQICGEYYELCWTQGSLNSAYDFISTPGKEYLGLRRINIVESTTMETFADYFGKDTDKFGEWKMEEGEGETTADTSGNDNIGYLFGGAFWSSEINSLVAMRSVDFVQDGFSKIKSKKENKKEKEKGIDHIIDSDEGRASIKLEKEKNKWPENMNIEGDYYATHDPIKLDKENNKKKGR